MRILGFTKKWPKLQKDIFTTFRFTRKDKDWAVEELVQIVFHPRSKDRKVLGVARIIRKDPKDLNKRWSYVAGFPGHENTSDMIIPAEAEDDGFTGQHGGGDTEAMRRFFLETYGYSKCKEPINKLTLYWIVRQPEVSA
jgi:hypothetical protein